MAHDKTKQFSELQLTSNWIDVIYCCLNLTWNWNDLPLIYSNLARAKADLLNLPTQHLDCI